MGLGKKRILVSRMNIKKEVGMKILGKVRTRKRVLLAVLDPFVSEAELAFSRWILLFIIKKSYYRNEEKCFPIYFHFVNSVPGRALLVLRE